MAHVCYAARLDKAIRDLCDTSIELHRSGDSTNELLTPARFLAELTVPGDSVSTRQRRARLWATLADEAGVPHPDLRVRKQVINRLRNRKAAAA